MKLPQVPWEKQPNDVRFVIASVAYENGIEVSEMLDTKARRRHISYARFEAMARIREMRKLDLETGQPVYRFSLPVTGSFFGADHTSVLHALRRRAVVLRELADAQVPQHIGAEEARRIRRIKSSASRARLEKRRKDWLARREAKASSNIVPAPGSPRRVRPPSMIRDDRHVKAILKQGGFCRYSEVEGRPLPDGSRNPRLSLPIVWPVDKMKELL